MRQSTDAELLSNYLLELHKLRKTVRRWSRVRWVFLLIVAGALWGVWVKTDWTLVASHSTTFFQDVLALFDKADGDIHSTLSQTLHSAKPQTTPQ